MTSAEAYTTFLQLANKLNSNDNANVDPGRFVLLYNKHADVWLEQKVRKFKDTQSIDDLQHVVKEDVSLVATNVANDHVDFKLPDDWYDNIGGYALCSKDSCKGRLINAAQIKNDNKRLVLFDANWRPDWDFEWLPVTVGQDHLQVFFKDFTVDSFYLDYFRYPRKIDIAGYIRPNGQPSTTIDPDMADIFVNEIIDLVVIDVSRIYENQVKVQLDKDRIQQET